MQGKTKHYRGNVRDSFATVVRSVRCLYDYSMLYHCRHGGSVVTGRLDWEDFDESCLSVIMRYGSLADKLVYKSALAGHRLICNDNIRNGKCRRHL